MATITSGAQMRHHYADVRARLYRPRSKPALIPSLAPVALAEPTTEVVPAIDELTALRLALARLRAISRRPSVVTVIAVVAQAMRLNPEDLLSDSRQHHHSRPRMLAMAINAVMFNRSPVEIGRGSNRNHATAIHAVKKFGELITTLIHEQDECQVSDRKPDGGTSCG